MVACKMSDSYHEELKRQHKLQSQLEEQMRHQETEKQREEHIKTQMDWLSKQEQ
jgi:hypothetical protein